MTHAHITTWVLALILFFVALGLHKTGKTRGAKIVHMIIRLFYIFIIATGGILFSNLAVIPPMYWVKAILGILVIAGFEMVLVFTKKEKPVGPAWILFIISFIVVVYLGFDLPQGF